MAISADSKAKVAAPAAAPPGALLPKPGGGRGGARVGAGRKASADPSVSVNITLPTSVAEKIKQRAKSQGMTLSKFVRSVLDRNT